MLVSSIKKSSLYILTILSNSGTCVAMILEGRGAVAKWRDVIGPSDPELAKYISPKRYVSRIMFLTIALITFYI